MGYELNRLMQQHGVSTPGVVAYNGSTPAERAAYDTYRAEYNNRVQNTPQYQGQQFNSAPARFSDEQLRAGREWFGSGKTAAETITRANELGATPEQLAAFWSQANKDPSAYDKTLAHVTNTMNTTGVQLPTQSTNYAIPASQTPRTLEEMYYTYLRRAPDAEGLAGWQTQFGTNTPSPEQQRIFLQQSQQERALRGLPSMNNTMAAGQGSWWGQPLQAPTMTPPVVVAPPPPPVTTTTTATDTTTPKPNTTGSGNDGTGSDGSSGVGTGSDGSDGSDGGPGTSAYRGGLIRQKYAEGGEVEAYPVAPPPELGGAVLPPPGVTAPVPQMGSPVSVSPAPGATPVSPGTADLMSMLSRYNQPSVYAGELKLARQRADEESKAFHDMIASAAAEKSEQPSKAEMYFRLAAAFGAPTKTGHFSESLGNVGQTLAEQSKEQRASAKADRASRLQLQMEAQKMKTQGARDELTTLRTLAGEEMKDSRALQVKALEQYIASGKPQSEAGKFAADQGFKPGTPEFAAAAQKYMDSKLESGDMYKQAMAAIAAGNLGVAQAGLALRQEAEARAAAAAKKLTPAEVKLRTETEDTLAATDSAMGDLRKAFKLNPNTFDNSVTDRVQRKALELAGSKDPKVQDTRELENLLGTQALSQMKAIFGAAPTEGERAILLSLQGIDAKSVEERKRIMTNAYEALARRKAKEKKRLDQIMAGEYRETQRSIEE